MQRQYQPFNQVFLLNKKRVLRSAKVGKAALTFALIAHSRIRFLVAALFPTVRGFFSLANRLTLLYFPHRLLVPVAFPLRRNTFKLLFTRYLK